MSAAYGARSGSFDIAEACCGGGSATFTVVAESSTGGWVVVNRAIQSQYGTRSTVAAAARCLSGGGVVFLPTDTVFGLAALPSRSEAVSRIFELKARPSQKNLPVMASSVDQLVSIGAQINDRVRRLTSSPFCPGPLSIAVGLDERLTPNWLRGRDELAFRIPKDEFLLAVLDEVGPLLVTSANRSGEGTARTVEDAISQLSGHPDLVIGGRECETVPSTLVNCRFSPPVIERIGAISSDELGPYVA